MTSRSSALAVVRINDGTQNLLVQCPSNVTLIVKSINYINQGTAAGVFYVACVRGVVNAYLINTASLALNAPQVWEGWFIMQPGDRLVAAAGSIPTHVWVSGTHLDSVAPSP